MDASKHWRDQLIKFQEQKRKPSSLVELLSVAESMASKIDSLKKEADEISQKLQLEIDTLKKENKELRDELDIAWKSY